MKEIKCTLGKTIEDIGTTRNALSVQSRVRSNTIINIVNDEVSYITFDALTKILEALDVIAKEKGINRTFDVSDVFVYE